MKKYILLSVAIFGILAQSLATVHTVTVADFSFTPNSVSAHVGDTIIWTWSSGTHTTTSTTIPAGAAIWNSNINSASTSFMYVPTVTGTYNYECTIHASMGMTGSFTVTTNAGIDEMAGSSWIKVFPNPVSTLLHVQFSATAAADMPVSFTLTDVNGNTVIKKKFKGLKDRDIDLQNVPNGNYVVYARQGDAVYNQQLVVAH